jgi:hypothetical protein
LRPARLLDSGFALVAVTRVDGPLWRSVEPSLAVAGLVPLAVPLLMPAPSGVTVAHLGHAAGLVLGLVTGTAAAYPRLRTALLTAAGVMVGAAAVASAVPTARRAVCLQPALAAQDASDRSRHLLEQGRVGEAVPLIEEALSYDPSNAEDWANLGVAREQSGDDIGALEAYRRAVREDPATKYRLNLGLLEARLGCGR